MMCCSLLAAAHSHLTLRSYIVFPIESLASCTRLFLLGRRTIDLARLHEVKDSEFEQRTQDLIYRASRAMHTYVEGTDFAPVVQAALSYEDANGDFSRKQMLTIAGIGTN